MAGPVSLAADSVSHAAVLWALLAASLLALPAALRRLAPAWPAPLQEVTP